MTVPNLAGDAAICECLSYFWPKLTFSFWLLAKLSNASMQPCWPQFLGLDRQYYQHNFHISAIISFWSLRYFEQVYKNKFYTENMLAALFEVFLTNMMKLMWLPRKVCHKWSALPRKFSLVYPRMLGSILGCLGNYPGSFSSKTLGKWCLPKQVKMWKQETNC